jgi:hypothetical protein
MRQLPKRVMPDQVFQDLVIISRMPISMKERLLSADARIDALKADLARGVGRYGWEAQTASQLTADIAKRLRAAKSHPDKDVLKILGRAIERLGPSTPSV